MSSYWDRERMEPGERATRQIKAGDVLLSGVAGLPRGLK
jgi:hypothetical protein